MLHEPGATSRSEKGDVSIRYGRGRFINHGNPDRKASGKLARAALCPGRQGTDRKARPSRSVPVWFREEISAHAVCNRAGFDGAERHNYWRDWMAV